MEAYRQALSRVHEAMQWFLVADELRVLRVLTSSSARLPVLEQVALSEHSADARTPFAVLEAPVSAGDDGWELRCEELRDDWEELAALYAGADPPLALPALEPPPPTHGLTRFVGELAWMLAHLPEALPGLTLVLAPVEIEDPRVWVASLRALLGVASLSGARFVVVELDEPHLAPLLDELGELVDRVDARVDEEAARRELAAMIDLMASAPPGADGARLAGLAGPSVAPPRRWNAPPELPPEDVARLYFDADLPPGLADQERVQALKVAMLRAAASAQAGDTATAIAEQRRARELADDIGLEREAVVLQIALGSYHLQGGDAPGAERAFESARTIALDRRFPELGAQAQLALAAAQLFDQRALEAAASYAWAGHLAHQCGQPVLAIEGYRLSGQLYAGEGRADDAAQAWQQALAIAEAAEPAERKASTAPEVADALAALLRARGLDERAASLEEQAALLRADAEEPPTPPTEERA